MKVGVLTKLGIFFSSRPFLQESQGINASKMLNSGDAPTKKIQLLVEKLILSDTGKLKIRLSFYEKIRLFDELNALLKKT